MSGLTWQRYFLSFNAVLWLRIKKKLIFNLSAGAETQQIILENNLHAIMEPNPHSQIIQSQDEMQEQQQEKILRIMDEQAAH